MKSVATDIFVLSFPKCGNTWLCRLLGDYLNSPVGAAFKQSTGKAIATEGQDRTGSYFVGQGHQMSINEPDNEMVIEHEFVNLAKCDAKIVLISRDPRDVCVSALHHWEMANIHEAIRAVGRGLWPLPFQGGFKGFYYSWLKCKQNVLMIQYEVLLEDTECELEWILEYLKVIPDTERIKEVVQRQSFESRRKWTEQHGDELNYGRDFQLNFLRKGKIGDWKNYFDEEAIKLSKHYFGTLIEEFGYNE